MQKEAPVPLMQKITEQKNNIFQLAGLVAAGIIALIALKTLKSPPPAAAGAGTPQLAYAGSFPALPAPSGGSSATATQAAIPAPPPRPPIQFPTANTEVRDKVAASVDQNPDVAARLVKSWLKDG
jgi:flagellar biosynthesis/type III secretory pathway M-ring protein FliF/YscJ